MKICKIDGCERKPYSRDWCYMHYHRWYRSGTTDLLPRAKPKEQCAAEGCNKPRRGHATPWCPMHEVRVTRYGNPETNLLPQRTRGSFEERYWKLVDKRGPDECWPWLGGLKDGYGRLITNGHREYAHRISYRLEFGDIATGLTIDHTCHNMDKTCWLDDKCPHRACQNPAHLEAVSVGLNVNRGRRRDHPI